MDTLRSSPRRGELGALNNWGNSTRKKMGISWMKGELGCNSLGLLSRIIYQVSCGGQVHGKVGSQTNNMDKHK